ncbi:hypothetical protein QTJ16_006089 [Diplocarpon rosae]|uniref:Folylpolyglutamate synthase n=1 Tax=Diplocarpon rosae TaxID=946125 RepID=A0AAD9SWR5_9HELO|nr:hypothetical protein QTJ16_006089 [Diplocarpon rosae]PBP23466.1 hypothetical protein BUE80_DR005568 [Diplocarpon rosae]
MSLLSTLRFTFFTPRHVFVHVHHLSTAATISPPRTYASALALLSTLQSNRAITASICSSNASAKYKLAIPQMLSWAHKAGYPVSDLPATGLRCIHVAGTKGKGSVSVMVENILLQYRRTGNELIIGKVGLYTSPHLIHVRERIRIDGVPISEELFTRYFYDLWDRLCGAGVETGGEKPGYFRYLTLLALHAFVQEGVRTAVVECGIGGEYDSTNILPADMVTATGITSLGIDHEGMLGKTIAEIAWHKGGVVKSGVPAFTVPQEPEAMAVLEQRAQQKGVQLKVVKRLPGLDSGEVKLGLEGDFQKDNASLAVALASSHLQRVEIVEPSTSNLPDQFLTGLESVSWPARCQYIPDGTTEWLIDGAHTSKSLAATAQWFKERVAQAYRSEKPPTAAMLIFNQADRDAVALLKDLFLALQDGPEQRSYLNTPPPLKRYTTGLEGKPSTRKLPAFGLGQKIFTYAAFCTNHVWNDKQDVDTSVQQDLANLYTHLDSNELCEAYGSVEQAVDLAYRVSEGDERVLVLVTGSLHLAGGVLEVIEQRRAEGKRKELGYSA